MAITKQDIIDTAEQLASEGFNPSMHAVRERLGSGSFATISPVLREWKEKREATTVAVLEMPSDIKGALDRFGADLWKAASALATAQFEKLKDESRFSVESANKERDEALEEIERLESKILEDDNRSSLVNAEVERLKSRLDDEHKKNAALEQRNLDLQETVVGLKSDLKESREDGKQALEKLDMLRQEQAELSRTNGQLTAKVDAMGKELVALTEARNEMKDELGRVSGSLASLQKVKDQVEAEKAKAVEQAEVAKAEAAGLLTLNNQYQEQRDDLKSQLAEFKKVIDSLSSEQKQASRNGSKRAQAKPKPEAK